MEYVNVFISILNILFAYFLLRETIKLRRVETEPDIAIFLEKNSVYESMYNLVIQNIGKGAGYDVCFDFNHDHPLFSRVKGPNIKSLGVFKHLKYIAPNERVDTFFGGQELLNPRFQDELPLVIEVKYRSKTNKEYNQSFEINPYKFWGLSYLYKENSLKKIASELNDIKKIIKR